ncbi:MAG: SPOR domain-containing protein, partial [Blastocatellia bacterium]
MKNAKVNQGIVPSLCLALLILFVCLAAQTATASPREYAVQIAAVRSQHVADDMRSGMSVQGLEAYWVKTILPEHGLFYRVRLGKFPSLETAYVYAEVLLNIGLLESYAITAFEAPMSGPLRDMTQASIEVQEYVHQGQQGPLSRETSELFAALGARQWLLPSSRNLFASVPPSSQVTPQVMSQGAGQVAGQMAGQMAGMNRRDMLVFALSSHEWRMTPDPSIFFVRAPMAAPTVNLTVSTASAKFEAAPMSQPTAPTITAQPPLTPPPPPNGAPAPNKGFTTDRNVAAEIGRGSKPTTSRGIGYGARNLGQARLQATAELRDGQLVMKLRNLDSDRSFTGTARVTLSDDKNSNEISPLQFNLAPEAEMVLPINDPVSVGNSWMLMVFDEGKVLRLLRGDSIGQRPVQAMQQGSPNSSDQLALSAPAYVTGVTGVYDATGAPTSVPQGMVPASESPNPSNNASGQGAAAASSTLQPQGPVAGTEAPASLTITPRQIAVTTENVTLEFEIASPQPLNYISVTLAAGEYRDVRQALMSTTRGRVPFLIPAAQATGTFVYEIKDEGGRVLGGGVGDFRQL